MDYPLLAVKRARNNNNILHQLNALASRLNAPIDFIKEKAIMPAVPNKRKAGKKFIGGYVSDSLKRQFKKVARKEAGGDAKKMLVTFMVEGLKRRGIHVDEEGK